LPAGETGEGVGVIVDGRERPAPQIDRFAAVGQCDGLPGAAGSHQFEGGKLHGQGGKHLAIVVSADPQDADAGITQTLDANPQARQRLKEIIVGFNNVTR